MSNSDTQTYDMDNDGYQHSANGKESHLQSGQVQGKNPCDGAYYKRYCEFPEKLSFHYDYSRNVYK